MCRIPSATYVVACFRFDWFCSVFVRRHNMHIIYGLFVSVIFRQKTEQTTVQFSHLRNCSGKEHNTIVSALIFRYVRKRFSNILKCVCKSVHIPKSELISITIFASSRHAFGSTLNLHPNTKQPTHTALCWSLSKSHHSHEIPRHFRPPASQNHPLIRNLNVHI